jgi:hypothetical protein
MTLLATYLVNQPSGAPQVFLIVAVTLCAVAAGFAAWSREVYRTLLAAAVGFLVLALLTR